MTTNITVCGHRVLLKAHFDSNEITTGALKGFIMEGEDTYKRAKAATVVGVVAGVGNMAWRAYDGGDPNWKPWAKVGDKVYFAKYAGKFITIEDEDYIICNDDDIQAVIVEETTDE